MARVIDSKVLSEYSGGKNELIQCILSGRNTMSYDEVNRAAGLLMKL